MMAIAKVAAVAALVVFTTGTAAAQSTDTSPTCADELGIAVHGQHVIGDYVTGISHEGLDWPPDGSEVGSTVADNGGVVVAGGPGPGFHFLFDIAPGASFCTGANSWGVPRGQ